MFSKAHAFKPSETHQWDENALRKLEKQRQYRRGRKVCQLWRYTPNGDHELLASCRVRDVLQRLKQKENLVFPQRRFRFNDLERHALTSFLKHGNLEYTFSARQMTFRLVEPKKKSRSSKTKE